MGRQRLLPIMCFCFLLLGGCGDEEYKPKAEEFFQSHMNLTPLPTGISEFRSVNDEMIPFSYGEGHLAYKAQRVFIQALLNHDKFFGPSPVNEMVHEFRCEDFIYESLYLRHILNRIDLEGKICYAGRFSPYAHIIIYNSETEMADHYYYGFRD